MHIFFNQKTSAVKKSITPLGHLRCIASHFWERSLGITGASHLKTCNSTSKQLSLCRVPGASQDWVNWDCRLVGTYLVKCGNMDGNGVSWFLSAAYPSISQGAPNSVWPCSSQRHFALPALGSLHIGKNWCQQSDAIWHKPTIHHLKMRLSCDKRLLCTKFVVPPLQNGLH